MDKLGSLGDSGKVSAQRRSGKLARQSISQIKMKQHDHSMPYQSMQMQDKSLQSLTLPDVTIGSSNGQRVNSSIQLKEILSDSRKEDMLIDDYNVRINAPFK